VPGIDPSVLLVVVALAVVTAALFLPAIRLRKVADAPPPWIAAVGAARGPLLLLVLVVLVRTLVADAGPAWADGPAWVRLARVVTTLAIAASMFRLVTGLIRVATARFDVSVSDNLRARQLHTLIGTIGRTVQIGIVLLALGAVLLTFDSARQLGTSLLASAGIASLVVGLAARPVLENLIAGVQIAITQPIRLDDVVVIEGAWGRVEEITATSVVVRIWDDRRLVVPLRHFVDHAVENWTRTSSRLLGTVFIHCDFEIDVAEVRAELARLCADDPDWDGRVAIVQVTDATERGVQLRALVSAMSGPRLWDLRCRVREGLVTFVNERCPEARPRVRASLEGRPGPVADAADTGAGPGPRD